MVSIVALYVCVWLRVCVCTHINMCICVGGVFMYISDVLLWTPHMDEQKQDDQLEHTYNSSVRIRDVALKTCQRQWTIGRSGERGSGISVLAARHDDDDDDVYNIFFSYYRKRNTRFFKFLSTIWLVFDGGFQVHFFQELKNKM